MSKIGYDMDGVLLPDYNKIPNLTDEEFYLQTLYASPLFQPTGEFDVVTARFDDARVREITEQWCNQLNVSPKNIFMRPRGNETPAEFKYRMWIEHGYSVYIESDPGIVLEMRKMVKEANVDIKVVHFAGFINNSIDNLAQ